MLVSCFVIRLRCKKRNTLALDETGLVTVAFLNDLCGKELG